MDREDGDFVLDSLKGPIFASELIKHTTDLISLETLQNTRNCIQEVKQYIKQSGYNFVLFTGRSGFMVDKLLGDIGEVQCAWLEKQDKRYNDPKGLELMLDELGINPNKCRLIVVDDRISSGMFKSRSTLEGLQHTKLENYGFAGIIGPLKYQTNSNMTKLEAKSGILQDTNIKPENLFFPDLKNMNVWELLNSLEKLSDYYEKSSLVREFIDSIAVKIHETGNCTFDQTDL